ncbi:MULTISPECIES: HXXEE domain-containing protein [Oceanobacillus]|uniref:HXXEE domain-containing protein n=1 Tax=Oceanobacillus indicireducens TaxID=1004261 RepID=A0A918CYZ6_9BACI|nr:HXXEE domain-containing protein [Oceanobacillus indicireducens]GGN51186.1 hypothetical protein GCM10007971_05480 [Oceanobacillus indicireducens]
MDIHLFVLIFTIIFMLHNLEEIMTIEKWFNKTYPRIRKRIPAFVEEELRKFETMNAARFSFVVFLLSIPVAILIVITTITEHYLLFLGLNLLFALNIFTYPVQSLYLRSYTPGLWTSVSLIIPYYIILSYHISNTGLLTFNNLLGAVVILILFIPIFLLSHKAAEKWN